MLPGCIITAWFSSLFNEDKMTQKAINLYGPLMFMGFVLTIILGMMIGYFGMDQSFKQDCMDYKQAFVDCKTKYENNCENYKGGESWDYLEESYKNPFLNLSIG